MTIIAAGTATRVRAGTTPAGVLAILARMPSGFTGDGASHDPDSQPSDNARDSKVPVFRDGRFSGFAERSTTSPAVTCHGDADLQRHLTATVSKQCWLDPDHVAIAVENHVVRLSGRADGTHAVLALRRIAAAAPCVTAIIDELWADCE
jgi:hypothetical protein